LLAARGPSAVLRLIIAVVIDPVDLVLQRRTTPHICEEVRERPPSVANLNPATAVALETVPARV
jgi:hypothetical protein